MDIQFYLDPVDRLITVSVTGPITLEDLNEGTDKLREIQGFDPTFDQLIDLRHAHTDGLNGAKFRAFLARLPVFDRFSKRAIVVGSKYQFGVMRMFELMANEERGMIRIFMDLAEAETWLGINEP